jgi:hypothetical protein
MRQINFRAWHKVRKEMYEVHGWNSEYVFKKTDDGVGNPGNPDLLSDVEIMQYTGLKDNWSDDPKDNKPIYEDDIVVFSDGSTHVVEWNDDTCQFQYSDGSPINNGERYGVFRQVIGNIYEDPELIN